MVAGGRKVQGTGNMGRAELAQKALRVTSACGMYFVLQTADAPLRPRNSAGVSMSRLGSDEVPAIAMWQLRQYGLTTFV